MYIPKEDGIKDGMLFYNFLSYFDSKGFTQHDINAPNKLLLNEKLAVISCYSNHSGYNAFLPHEFIYFRELINESSEVIGFGNINCGDIILNSHHIEIKTNYDLLTEAQKEKKISSDEVIAVFDRDELLAKYFKGNLPFYYHVSKRIVRHYWRQHRRIELKRDCLMELNAIVRLFQQKHRLYDPFTEKFVLLPFTELEKETDPYRLH